MDRLIPRLSAAERMAFIAAARSLVGVPFKHRGRSERGIDCLGVVAYALRAVGREPVDERVYERNPSADAPRLRASLIAHFGEPVPALVPGCVVSMAWHDLENHVAVIGSYPTDGLSLIHATAAEQRVIETRYGEPWPRRVIEAWRP